MGVRTVFLSATTMPMCWSRLRIPRQCVLFLPSAAHAVIITRRMSVVAVDANAANVANAPRECRPGERGGAGQPGGGEVRPVGSPFTPPITKGTCYMGWP